MSAWVQSSTSVSPLGQRLQEDALPGSMDIFKYLHTAKLVHHFSNLNVVGGGSQAVLLAAAVSYCT